MIMMKKIAINSQSHIKRVAITIKVYKPTLKTLVAVPDVTSIKNSLSVITLPIYFVPASISKYSMPSSYDQLVAYDNGWLFGTPFHGHSTLSNGMFSFEKCFITLGFTSPLDEFKVYYKKYLYIYFFLSDYYHNRFRYELFYYNH